MLRRQLLTGLLMTVVMVVLVGLAYPLVVTGLSAAFMSRQANGSVVQVNGKDVGSSLLGQSFTDKDGNALAQYFQPRPSAGNYNGLASGGSNLAPSNAKLVGNVPRAYMPDGSAVGAKNPYATPTDPYCVPVTTTAGKTECDPNTVPERAMAYRTLNGLASNASVPVDAVTTSGSGLDPNISVANARLQAARVAKARGLTVNEVNAAIDAHTQGKQWGFLGEQTVNVLNLNLALDQMKK